MAEVTWLPVTHIDGMPVRTYAVTVLDPRDHSTSVEETIALSAESAVEMCQEALDMDTEDWGAPALVAVAAVDIGPGRA